MAPEPPSTPPRPARRRVLARRAGTLALTAASLAAVVVLARRVEGLDLGERLRGADPGAVAAAALLSLVPLFGNVVSMLALSPVRLPFWRTSALWLSTSFLNLLTPASTGGVALTVRYLQRQGGLPLAVAATTIGLVQSTAALVTGVLLVLSVLAAGRGRLLGAELPWPLVVAALVAAGAAALAVSRWPRARRELRERVAVPVRREWPALRRALTDPGRLALALLGHLAVPLGFAAALAACARAFGGEPATELLVLVVVGSSAVTAAVPVPGGVGAAEAALAAGLVVAGLDPGTALSAALLHRVLTFWARVPPAWVAVLWLRRRRAL